MKKPTLRADEPRPIRRPCPTDDGDYPPPCISPDGHEWVVSDETGACYCCNCLADGDA